MTASIPKILLLLTVPHLSSTGSPYREMMALARYLPKDDFQITVCSLRNNGFAETAPILEELGCRVIVARFRPRGRRLSHLWASLKDQKLIAQHGPFDLQHSLDFSAWPVEALFSKMYTRAFIFSQSDLAWKGHRAGIWLKIRLAKKVVAISDVVVQLLNSLGADPQKVEKIPLGIEENATNPGGYPTKTDTRFILSVGHIQQRKRHQDAIRALGRLIPEIPDLSLLIAGEIYDQSYYQELQDLSQALGLEHRVHFLGVRDDIPALMKNASAMLLCSESEAFGWVILEAMSAGLPVVAPDSGGPGEIITNGLNGALVPVADIDAYAQALRQIILDPGWAASLTKNAYHLISTKYSAKEMVAKFAKMYKSLMVKTPDTERF